MRKYGTRCTLLLGMIIALSLPLTAIAGGRPDSRPHVSQHRRHVSQHRRHVSQHRPHGHRHQHRSHHGVRFGIIVSGHFGATHYPHGHHLHVHSSHCPVVVEQYVHHHAFPAPVWHVHHYVHHSYGPHTSIHIVVSADHGDIYVDGRHVGHGQRVRDGRLRLPVAPGEHLVQFRIGKNHFTRQVHVPSGATTVVEARLQR